MKIRFVARKLNMKVLFTTIFVARLKLKNLYQIRSGSVLR